MSSSEGSDVWSLISGTIGVLTVLPLICAYIWNQHPEIKLAQLDSTLKDTESLLRSVVEEGLLDPERHVAHFELHLKKFRRKTERYRDETFAASNEWRKLLRAWYNGLSKRISLLCTQVKTVRANICETSATARMQLLPQSPEDTSPFHSRWRSNVLRFWQYIVLLVGRRTTAELVANAAAPVASTPPMVDDLAASAEERRASIDAGDDTHSGAPCDTCKRSGHRPKSRYHTSAYMSDTAPRSHQFRVLVRAIRRVDRELTAQGVPNNLLTHLVQATHKKKWSPASSKAYRPRRSRRHRNSVPSMAHAATMPQHDVDSDASDSSGEETMCEV